MISRIAADGTPRFVARAIDLDDLVRLGFDQVRIAAAPHPVVARRLIDLMDAIDEAATERGHASTEVQRQLRLLREGVAGNVPTPADEDLVQGT